MKVIKFGGTSVGEVYSIEQICYIFKDKKKQKDRYTIIVSAISGITDTLVKCAQFAKNKNEKYHLILDEIEIKHLNIIRKLFRFFHKSILINRIIKLIYYLDFFFYSIYNIAYFSKKSLDKIMNFGELISSFLINEKLKENGFHSSWNDSRELIEIEKKSFNVNLTKSYLRIKFFFIKNNSSYIIFPGFIASSKERDPITLGRGGSDYSSSILSAALQTSVLEIWTDISGIMTALPHLVFKSFPIENISFLDVIELSHFGAKVLYPPTILSSMRKNIPILIRNTFSPLEKGTIIYNLNKRIGIIIGITGIQNITYFLLEKKVYLPSYTKSDNFHGFIKKILSGFTKDLSDTFTGNKELSIITIIVNDMKNILVILGKMSSVLTKENIKPYVIASSKKNISAVIEKKYFKSAMNILHDIFFEKPYKKIHLFIAGLGKVGNKLIEQLYQQKDYLIEELHMKLKIIAICNSKRMHFNLQGININNWQENIKLGTSNSIEEFKRKLYNVNIRHTIFIDNTDSKDIAKYYLDFLVKKIGVITCSKIACTSSYHEYKNIKNISRSFKTPFFFETNVGAGLPIINTLNYLVQSGDKIYFIYAVLSGSLNFIFKNFKGSFIDIIKKSFSEGFTEPDPRFDLSGIDVLRKILILLRECGEKIELEDIKQISLLTKSCIKSFTEDSFYQKMIFNEEFFTQLRIVAKEQRKRIIYMAKYKDGKIYLGIEDIEYKHPFYHLESKDNMILFTTERYVNQPLLIKGAGAGAEVTASGVFSDIIKASL